MNNKLITVILGVTIGVIMIATVMAPILNDTAEVERTFDNGPIFGLVPVEDLESTTYTLSEGVLMNGDEIIPYSDLAPFIILDNTTIFRMDVVDGVLNINAYGSVSIYHAYAATITVTDSAVSIVYSAPGAGTDLSKSYSYTEGLFAVSEADVGYALAGSALTVLGDTEIESSWVAGNTSTGYVVAHVQGSIDGGFTATALGYAGAAFTGTISVVADTSEIQGYEDAYLFNGFTVTIKNADGTATFVGSAPGYVTASEVTSEKTEHLDSGSIAIIKVIPLMTILALLVGICAVATLRKN